MQSIIQNIIMGLIVASSIGFIIWRTIKILTRKSHAGSQCANCEGCALKPKSDCTVPEKYKG